MRSIISLAALMLLLYLLGTGPAAFAGVGQMDITQHFKSARITTLSAGVSGADRIMVEKIFAGKRESLFTHPPETGLRSSQEVLWYQASLPVTVVSSGQRIMAISSPNITVALWYLSADGRVQALVAQVNESSAFLLPENHNQDLQLVFRLASTMPANLKVELWSKLAWDNNRQWQLLWYGILLGVVAALVLYQLLFLKLKDYASLYFVLHIVLLLLLVMNMNGMQRIIPGIPMAPLAWLALAAASGVAFCRQFLKIGSRSGIILMVATGLIGLLSAVPANIVPDSYLYAGVLFFSGLSVGYCLYISLLVYYRGEKSTRFLIPAFATTVAVWCLYSGNLLVSGFAFISMQPILELTLLQQTFFLALALTDRIRSTRMSNKYGENRTIKAQKLFSRQVIRMQETERERFSNTLHDSIGHGLLVLKHNLHSLAETTSKAPETQTRIEGLTAQCENVLADVRGLSHDLHPHTLHRLGLKAAIESTAELAFAHQAIDCATYVAIVEEQLEDEQKIAVYRIVQEALNNVLKHSEAKEVILSVQSNDQELRIEIKDDGKGIPENKTIEEGIGFSTMSGRAELLGGWMKVISSAAHGTILRFGIPLL